MIKVVILIKRKAGVSREEFIDYYENKHVPLINSYFSDYQADYKRTYVNEGGPNRLLGTDSADRGPEPFQFDVLTEIWIKDQATMEAMFAKAGEPELAAIIAADEENFSDRGSVQIYFGQEYS